MDGSDTSTNKIKRSRPVKVADQIKQWVVERDLKGGDKLPNESEMIELFGVSKGTVREALRILEAQGLIITKTGPGGGSIIGEVSAERASSLLANYFYFQDLSLSDIYQMRKALEPELVASCIEAMAKATKLPVTIKTRIGYNEVENFEENLSTYINSTNAIGVANGLDALRIILKAYIELGKLKEGDEIIVPSNTFIASVLAITDVNLKPVFVEPDPQTYNLDAF